MIRLTQISIVTCFLLGMTFFPLCAQNKLSVEAASKDVTLTVRGVEKEINYVNPSDMKELDNCIIFLSSSYGKTTGLKRTNCIAVQVDNQMKVTKVTALNESADISIPEKGFVLIASDTDYKTKGYKKFLAENFKEGDVVKLRVNNEISSISEADAFQNRNALFSVDYVTEKMFTSLKKEEQIAGKVSNLNKGSKYVIELMNNGKLLGSVSPGKEGKFTLKAKLQQGVNYFDVIVKENNKNLKENSFVIYQKATNRTAADVVMWVEQFPNALTFLNEDSVENMMLKCKAAGVTAFGLDVKGPEGYVSYKKNDLSKTPYYTSTINPKKKVAESNMDLLESFVKLAHKHQMKVYASFNFFTEGNVTTSDYAVLKQHPDWEEIVQRPEDKGQLMKVSESTAGQEARAGKRIILGFVNPANKEVQDFQLLRVEEVLKNYAVDGIVMDRCRYDNLYADFSDVSKQAFSSYLQQEGKQLANFPADAFLIDKDGKMIEGKYFTEWITFRSQVIKQFTDRVRSLVNKYKAEKNPDLKMAAYVGSWFEVYWQNGVNWSSKNFRYDNRLGFPESRLYTDKYYQTSYTGNIDFLMIGTYYKTAKEVNKYITIGNILTNGELPLYGSMSLPDLKNEEQAEVFKASLVNSSGLMLFDLCYVNWNLFPFSLKKALEKK